MQTLCQYLMTRDGAPASFYVPGQPSANNYNYNVFGATFYFPLSLAIQEGNPKLDSETADTYTAGVVWNIADRLTFTLDWYQVELDKAIAIPGHEAVYQQCLDAKFNPLVGSAPGSHTGAELAAANPFCSLIQREYIGNGPPGTPGNVGGDRKFKAQYINSGGIQDEGYDVQVDWGIGNFNINFQTSFLDLYSQSPFPGAAFTDYTGTTQNTSFDYRFFSTVRWGKGPLSLGLRMQYLPSLKPVPGSSSPCSASTRTSSSISSAAGTSSSVGSCAAASTTCSTRTPSGSADDDEQRDRNDELELRYDRASFFDRSRGQAVTTRA